VNPSWFWCIRQKKRATPLSQPAPCGWSESSSAGAVRRRRKSAGLYVEKAATDVAGELKQRERKLGSDANRFEPKRLSKAMVGNPQKGLQIFLQLIGNGDGQIERGGMSPV
jgi:hypothetical protein